MVGWLWSKLGRNCLGNGGFYNINKWCKNERKVFGLQYLFVLFLHAKKGIFMECMFLENCYLGNNLGPWGNCPRISILQWFMWTLEHDFPIGCKLWSYYGSCQFSSHSFIKLATEKYYLIEFYYMKLSFCVNIG